MILHSLNVSQAEFEAGTGWAIKPEGACKADVCIPLSQRPEGDLVNVESMAEQIGLPLVSDAERSVWALGPASVGSRTLLSAEAPELTLPDINGRSFSLSSLQGKKVVLVAWSPY